MKKYESVIIINPKLSENEINVVTSNVQKKIGEFGKITNSDDLGIKKLAYEIRKNKEGHYLIYQFEVNEESTNAISEIERFYRITDEIIKFIIVRMD